MKKTAELNLNMPEREDKVKINDFNQNAENLDGEISVIKSTLLTKAPIYNPIFIGNPQAPNPNDPTKTEPIATTGFVLEALEVEKLD
jgi:hypothetical protein